MSETIEDTFAVGDNPKLVVEGEVGDVIVESEPGNIIGVRSTLEHPERLDYEVRQEGGAITVKARKKYMRGRLRHMFASPGRADITATVPTSTEVELATVVGDVELRGIEGSGKLSTLNGRVILYDSQGDFKLSSLNGKVSMDNVKGAFHGTTVNGAIELNGELTPGGENRLKTVNGSVQVRLTSAAGVRLAATTIRGSVHSTVPALDPGPCEDGPEPSNGEASLFVSTVNGSVSVE